MILVFDTGILGALCHPTQKQNRPVVDWLQASLDAADAETSLCLPEIADYELRRKLLHMIARKQADARSLARLDELGELLDYLPVSTQAMRLAAQLWADSRAAGVPTAGDATLDGDVILAAQALAIQGTVVTNNVRHLTRFVAARTWQDCSFEGVFAGVLGAAPATSRPTDVAFVHGGSLWRFRRIDAAIGCAPGEIDDPATRQRILAELECADLVGVRLQVVHIRLPLQPSGERIATILQDALQNR